MHSQLKLQEANLKGGLVETPETPLGLPFLCTLELCVAIADYIGWDGGSSVDSTRQDQTGRSSVLSVCNSCE